VSGAQSPREVLEAVRRLEADLEAIRRRARERERDMEDLRAGIAADAATERRALVEDLERVVELIGASWQSTHDQISGLAQEVAGLRRFAEGTAAALREARVELRLEHVVPNGMSEHG
jgi:hypothetical protein